MSETPPNKETPAADQPVRKPNIFSRIVRKIDDSMKKKADAAARQSNCCGDDDKKGPGKCC
jgi:hypothetical protein